MDESRNVSPDSGRLKVSIIVFTYRSTRELPECIDSVLSQGVPLEMFLVDNASPDGTPEMAANYAAAHRNIHAILSPENVGLAAANNIPSEQCKGDYILLLNPDTMLPAGSVGRMVAYLDENADI